MSYSIARAGRAVGSDAYLHPAVRPGDWYFLYGVGRYVPEIYGSWLTGYDVCQGAAAQLDRVVTALSAQTDAAVGVELAACLANEAATIAGSPWSCTPGDPKRSCRCFWNNQWTSWFLYSDTDKRWLLENEPYYNHSLTDYSLFAKIRPMCEGVIVPGWEADVPPPPIGRPSVTAAQAKVIVAQRKGVPVPTKQTPESAHSLETDADRAKRTTAIVVGAGAAALGAVGLLVWLKRRRRP